MASEGDRYLQIIGIVLAVGLFISTGLLVFVAIQTSPNSDTKTIPKVNWTVSRINESHVRLIHAGGKPVDTANIMVTVDGIKRYVSWSNTLTQGDSGTVRAREGQIVRIFWVKGKGNRILMESFTV
ncbi:MAG: hypothetical protein ABEI06_02370 [Halobacteriaceae archaeon]